MNIIIVIAGPTGVGKTELSLFLASKLNGEIINADSTQVYKGMNIATNKVVDTRGIKHHIFDEVDLDYDYTVFDYQMQARKIIDDVLSRGKVPILVGGTGLYIKATLYNYEFNVGVKKNYDGFSNEELYEKLLLIDPDTKIHLNNRVRIINALNYYDNNNEAYSKKKKADKLLYDVIFIGLTTDRSVLYSRINSRVDAMIDEGLIFEARDLYEKNIRTKAVMTPIGYKELFEYFDGKISMDEATELIKKRSRHYAKRQYTWFKNQLSLRWFDVNFDDFSKTEFEILKYIENITS